MVLRVGTGVGAGLVLGGSLLHGHLGAAGEIGHVVVDPDGERCACSRTGCLETILAVPHLRRGVAEPGGGRGGAGRVGEQLGAALAPVVGTLNLHELVLSGPAELLDGPLLEAADRRIRARTMPVSSDRARRPHLRARRGRGARRRRRPRPRRTAGRLMSAHVVPAPGPPVAPGREASTRGNCGAHQEDTGGRCAGHAGLTTLAACGSDDDGRPATDGGPEKADIRVWLNGTDTPQEARDWLKKTFEDQNPGSTLTIEQQEWDGLVEKLTTALSSESETPDVVEIGNTQAPTFTSAGAFST